MSDPRWVPVSRERHGDRFWCRFSSYGFARRRRHVPVVPGELAQVAAALPVLFFDDGTGPAPVALLRLAAEGVSALVAENGVWLGVYVPAALRVHPFSAEETDGGRMTLLVDEASGLITEAPEHERFFTDEGAPAPALEEVVAFFRRHAASARAGRAACAALAGRGLLSPFVPPEGIAMPDAERYLALDRARFEALDDDDVLAMHRAGALGVAHAHLISLAHLRFLAHVERRAAVSADRIPAPTAAPAAQERLAGFLDALADARADENTVELDEMMRPCKGNGES